MDRRQEEILRAFSKWWGCALRELLNWSDSQIEAWLEKTEAFFAERPAVLNVGAVDIMSSVICPPRQKVEAHGIHIIDLNGMIQRAIKIGMHGEGDAWLDPSNADWVAIRRRINNVLALVGESLPDRTDAE